MPLDLAGVEFTRATIAHGAAADEYREAIVKRWGGRALVSLAPTITAARMCPTVKYVPAHRNTCTRVSLAARRFDHDRVPALMAVRTG